MSLFYKTSHKATEEYQAADGSLPLTGFGKSILNIHSGIEKTRTVTGGQRIYPFNYHVNKLSVDNDFGIVGNLVSH